MHFELLIPTEADAEEALLTVEASDWMSALRVACAELGRELHPGLLCDIQADQSVHVTDPRTQEALRIRPLSRKELDLSLQDTFDLDDAERRELLASEPEPSGRVLTERRFSSGTFQALPKPASASLDAAAQRQLEEVLEAFQGFYASERALRDVSERVLELATRLIPCESSAVLFPGLQGHDLYFAAARGPVAEQVLRYRIPVDVGIIGFCLHEGVSLAVPDAAADPRFFALISRKLRYTTGSLVCAPLSFDGRVYGGIELLNREGGGPFTRSEVAMLSHIARQFAQYIHQQM